MVEDTLELQVRLGGLGDIDGDERTLSDSACERINQIVRSDLRERYVDLDEDTTIKVGCVAPPNVAIITKDRE